MFKRHAISSIAIGGALFALGASTAIAQNFPAKPIRIITSGAGSGADIAIRMIAPGIAPLLGQPVIVENRGSGVIPAQTVLRAPADGYVLLYEGSGLWLRTLFEETPYDTMRDFQPITQSLLQPALMVVTPSLPVSTPKELIALAKSKPGALNYATGSTGSITHLASELFQSMAGVQFTRISYKSGALAAQDVISGRVQIMFAVAPSLLPHVRSGKLKALGVTTLQPTELVPGIAPIANTLPGYESASNTGLFAPAKTPRSATERIHRDFVRVLLGPELKDKWAGMGVEPVGSTPEQFEKVIRNEVATIGKLVKDRNLRESN